MNEIIVYCKQCMAKLYSDEGQEDLAIDCPNKAKCTINKSVETDKP